MRGTHAFNSAPVVSEKETAATAEGAPPLLAILSFRRLLQGEFPNFSRPKSGYLCARVPFAVKRTKHNVMAQHSKPPRDGAYRKNRNKTHKSPPPPPLAKLWTWLKWYAMVIPWIFQPYWVVLSFRSPVRQNAYGKKVPGTCAYRDTRRSQTHNA